jgi:hypothetical protein
MLSINARKIGFGMIVLIAVIALAIAGGIWYWKIHKAGPPASSTTNSASSTQEFLIPEWGVEFQMPEGLSSLVYHISDRPNQAGIATFSTKDLENIAPTCSPNTTSGIGSLARWLYDASDTTAAVHIGGYIYSFIEVQGGICTEPGVLPGDNVTVTTATKLFFQQSNQLEQAIDYTLASASSSATSPRNALLSPLTGSVPLTVTASIPYGDCDGFSINWGDKTSESLGAGPGCPAIVVKTFSNQHTYQEAGTYTVVANTVGGRSISEIVNAIDSGNSKSPQILSPSTGQVITIGDAVRVAWEGIDGVYYMVAAAPTRVVSGDDVVVGLHDLLGDPNTEGNTEAQAAFNVVPNTGSFLWDTSKVPPGEYSFYIGTVDSDPQWWVTPLWFIPAQSSNVAPTVVSASAAYIASATTTVSDSYSLTIHGTHFTSASYAYLINSGTGTPYGSLIPVSVSPDGASLTVSPVTSYAGQTWSVRVYNGTQASKATEFVMPYPGI